MSKSAAKRKNPPVVQSDNEDGLDVVPTTPPESGALEMRPMQPLQEEVAADPIRPPTSENWWIAASRLGQLLETAAPMVAQMSTAVV
ncbi:unnamed protein product [Lampetra planeri]